jgi:hypothetical protein
LARESSNAMRLATENDASVLSRILEIAKWPERDAEEEWNLDRWGEGPDSSPREAPKKSSLDEFPLAQFDKDEFHRDEFHQLADDRSTEPYQPSDIDHPKQGNYADWAELIRGESLSYPAGTENKKKRNAAKVVGGIVAGLLLIGGVVDAYRNSPAPPSKLATPASPVIPTRTQIASREAAKPLPRSIPPSILTPSVPPPDIATPVLQPDEGLSASRRSAQVSRRRVHRRPVPDYELRDPLDAPMTLTPDTAPPPQRPAVPGSRYLPTGNRFGG